MNLVEDRRSEWKYSVLVDPMFFDREAEEPMKTSFGLHEPHAEEAIYMYLTYS